MSKAEFDKNLPEGVSLGKDFFKGKSIDVRRDVLAEKHRISFPEELADLYIIRKTAIDFLKLPILGSSAILPIDSWVPRVDPLTGSIWTTRWARDVKLHKTSDKKHELDSADDFVAIGGRKFSEDVNFKEMPLSWVVAQLIPQQFKDGVEAAMRVEDEIAHDYSRGGPEDLRILAALADIYEKTEELKKPKLLNQDIEEMAKRTEKTLVHENILTSRDSMWQKMVINIQRAAKKDSLNRINPSASRFLAISAYLTAIDRESLNGLIRGKAERTFSYLFIVRLGARLRVRQSLESLEAIGRFSQSCGYAGLEARYQNFANFKDAVDIEQMFKLISDQLREIQVAPYFIYARLVDAILMGKIFKTNKEIAQLKRILKPRGLLPELTRPSADEYLRKKDLRGFYNRVRQAYTILKFLLNDPDYKVYTVFSEQIPEM